MRIQQIWSLISVLKIILLKKTNLNHFLSPVYNKFVQKNGEGNDPNIENDEKTFVLV